MKFLNIFLCGILMISTALQAKIIEETQTPEIKEVSPTGCGYSRPIVIAGMVGNPPFGWVERHDERSSKDLESYGLGRSGRCI